MLSHPIRRLASAGAIASVTLASITARAQRPTVPDSAARTDSAARADSAHRAEQRLKAVTIVATPTDAAEPVSALHVSALRLERMPTLDAWDLLRQAAGIEVHSQGQGPGFASDASMRGFSSDHSTDLALWVDGVPVNEPVNGHAEGYNDWSLIFPRVVSGIDVTRGPSNPLFGNFALSGAVNVLTIDRVRESSASLTSGSFGLADATFMAGFDHGGRGGGVFGARFVRQDGFRPNSTLRLAQGHLRLSHDISSNHTIDGGVELYDTHWHSPGFLNEQEFAAREYGVVSNPSDGGQKQRAQERISLRVVRPEFVWRTTAYATQGYWQLFLTIPPAGGRFEGTGSQTEEDDHRYGGGLTSALTWTIPSGEMTVGVEGRADHAHYENYFTTGRRRDSTNTNLTAQQLSGALFVALTSNLASRVRVDLGGRADNLSTTSTPGAATAINASHGVISPKIGATLRITDWLSAFGNASRGFRSADGVISDPARSVITVWAYEGGIRLQRAAARLSVDVFQMNVSNEQTFNPVTRGSANGGTSRRKGIEVDRSAPVLHALMFDGSWTFNDAVYTSRTIAGNDPPASPVSLAGLPVYNTARYVGTGGLEWSSAESAWHARVAGNWVGPYSPFDEPGVVLPAYGLLHVSGGLRTGKTSIDLGVRNALDRGYPELVAGHIISPGQPRALFGSVRLAF
ncbi:MAG TPA: TonB-dependent receptor [Gemmatimonadaceae bacterium]|nr:TonB-dependent receptor [Gemmatimonadaceae bacterium]